MSQGPLCPNLTKEFQKEVSQMANRNFPCPMLIGGLSVNLNHLKSTMKQQNFKCYVGISVIVIAKVKEAKMNYLINTVYLPKWASSIN